VNTSVKANQEGENDGEFEKTKNDERPLELHAAAARRGGNIALREKAVESGADCGKHMASRVSPSRKRAEK
jgi:hypothetical protein